MRMTNDKGQEIYFNETNHSGKTLYIVKAISENLEIKDRDRKPHKSRAFTQLKQAENWIERNGFK